MLGILGAGNKLRVSDSFTRADSAVALGSADTGHLWAIHTGTLGIASNKAYSIDNTANARATLDSGLIDGVFTMDLYSDNYGTVGPRVPSFIFRGIDATNFLLTTPYNGVVYLSKWDEGVSSDLASLAMVLTNGQTYTFKAEAQGALIKIYVDTVLKITYTLVGADATKYGAAGCTRAGIRVGGTTNMSNVRFDNLKVEEA